MAYYCTMSSSEVLVLYLGMSNCPNVETESGPGSGRTVRKRRELKEQRGKPKARRDNDPGPWE